MNVSVEKQLLENFTQFIRTQRILVIEGTRSQENLLYKDAAPDSERGIVSIAKELKRLQCTFEVVESSSDRLDNAIAAADIVLIYAHGEYGEDGRLQGWLDYKGRPYPGPGVLASAICLDKLIFKQLMTSAGLRTPIFQELEANDFALLLKAARVGYPLMAKLRTGGSSIGITRIENEAELLLWEERVGKANAGEYFFEKFVNGRFLTVGLIEFPGRLVSMPLLEVEADGGFYDKETKLGIDASRRPRFTVPAQLRDDVTKQISDLATALSVKSGCEGIGRVDVMLDNDGCRPSARD